MDRDSTTIANFMMRHAFPIARKRWLPRWLIRSLPGYGYGFEDAEINRDEWVRVEAEAAVERKLCSASDAELMGLEKSGELARWRAAGLTEFRPQISLSRPGTPDQILPAEAGTAEASHAPDCADLPA